MSNHIVLTRKSFTPWGVFGELKFPGGEMFYTVERPWRNNEAFVSCIPDGVYMLEKRYSPVVNRTSGGEFQDGWEVTDVRGRDYIMLHPANWMGDLEGCIGVGLRYEITQNRQGEWAPSVMDSRAAFRQVMDLLDHYNDWSIDIRPFIMSTY